MEASRSANQKAAVTGRCSAAPEPPVPEAHSVVDFARRQSPWARASRQGRQSFFFDSVVKMRRMWEVFTYRPIDASRCFLIAARTAAAD